MLKVSSLLFGEDRNVDGDSATTTPRGDSIKSIHSLVKSPAFLTDGAVSLETFQQVSGRGFAPWEVHRPQQAVRELLTAGCFSSGSVLDCGCGIGDNSLFIAKYTSCSVDAVDMLPQCIAFAQMKAGLRNMVNRVGWQCFNLLQWDSSPLAGRTYDTVLDSGLLHCLDGPTRAAYVGQMRSLLRPGGSLYVLALSDKETSPGGPSRLSQAELESLLSPSTGWALQYIKPHYLELHPTFWGGKGRAYLAAAQRCH